MVAVVDAGRDEPGSTAPWLLGWARTARVENPELRVVLLRLSQLPRPDEAPRGERG